MLGVIGTYGNVSADTAVRNTVRAGTVGVSARSGITWFDTSLMGGLSFADAGCAQFHGTDGLGGFGPACAPVFAHCPIRVNRTIQAPHTVYGRVQRIGHSSGADFRRRIRRTRPACESCRRFVLTFAYTTAAMAGCPFFRLRLPEGVQIHRRSGPRYGSDVTVVATGPLTDVDAALTAAPEIASKLRW